MIDIDDFKNDLKEIKAECEKTSGAECGLGKCKYSVNGNDCLFECLGIDSPYTWTLGGKE